MFPLTSCTFGNRRPDVFGNVHIRWDDRGRPVFRNPGKYSGRHRTYAIPASLRLLAKLAGEHV